MGPADIWLAGEERRRPLAEHRNRRLAPCSGIDPAGRSDIGLGSGQDLPWMGGSLAAGTRPGLLQPPDVIDIAAWAAQHPPGSAHRQPLSRVASSSASQMPTQESGEVARKEESWWGTTSPPTNGCLKMSMD